MSNGIVEKKKCKCIHVWYACFFIGFPLIFLKYKLKYWIFIIDRWRRRRHSDRSSLHSAALQRRPGKRSHSIRSHSGQVMSFHIQIDDLKFVCNLTCFSLSLSKNRSARHRHIQRVWQRAAHLLLRAQGQLQVSNKIKSIWFQPLLTNKQLIYLVNHLC